MTYWIGLILAIISCALIAYQDLSSRYIHIFTLILLAGGFVTQRSQTFAFFFSNIVINAIFLAFLFLILYCYFFLKYRSRKKFVDRYMGLGDVVILTIFSSAYNLHNYTLFLICGCVLSLIYYILRKTISKKATIRIPFAGCLAINHLIFVIISYFTSLDLLYDAIFEL